MTNQPPGRFTIDDLYELGWLEDPRLSPDGRYVAVVWVTVDRVGNGYRRHIVLVATDGGQIRRFTRGKQDRQPRWSPDGRWIAFVSNRDDERGQIYIIPVDGGEARQITSHPNGASDPAWSPDGRYIAFLAPVNAEEQAREDAGETPPPPADAWEARRSREQRQHEEEMRVDPRVITKLPYRSGTSYFDDRRRHIYLVEVTDDDQPSTPRRLTSVTSTTAHRSGCRQAMRS